MHRINRDLYLALSRGLAYSEAYPSRIRYLLSFCVLCIVLAVRGIGGCFGGRYCDQYWSLIGAVLLTHSHQYWLAR